MLGTNRALVSAMASLATSGRSASVSSATTSITAAPTITAAISRSTAPAIGLSTFEIGFVMAATGPSAGSSPSAVQDASQVSRNRLQVHEVAKSRPGAFAHLVLAAASFSEVGDGAQLRVDGASSEPAVVQVFDGAFGVLFSSELDVDVTHQMIAQVVTDVHLLDFPVLFFGFNEAILEKVVIMFLEKQKIDDGCSKSHGVRAYLHLVVADIGQM